MSYLHTMLRVGDLERSEAIPYRPGTYSALLEPRVLP